MSRPHQMKNRFLPSYLLFSLTFLIVLLFLLLASFHLTQYKSESAEVQNTEPSSYHVVVIDAGHGGEDGGTVGVNGVYEKDLNLKIASNLEQMLGAGGIETVMTRSEDILLYDKNSNYQGQKKVQDLANRKKIAEQYENVVFVSIHMNSFPNPKYSGLQVYYSLNDPRSLALAQKIQSISKETLMPDNERKIKPTNGSLYLLDRLKSPAVLIECGFLSNPNECARLSSEEYQQQLSLAIALAIFNYFSLSPQNHPLGS